MVPRGTTGVLESAGFVDEGPVLEVEVDEAAAQLPSDAAVAEDGTEATITAAPDVESTIPVFPPRAVPADLPAVVAATPAAIPPVVVPPNVVVPPAAVPSAVVPAKEQPAKRPLMWSAATVHANPGAPKPLEADQSHVPPMLRSLRKCKACGFPVSEGRTLCVECDEKQWRGQPLSGAAAKGKAAGPAVDFRQGGTARGDAAQGISASSPGSSGTQSKPAPVGGVRPSASSSAASAITPFVSSSATPNSSFSSPAAAPAAVRVAPQSLAAALAELNEQEKRIEAARQGLAIDVPPALPTDVRAAVPVAVPARSSESAPQPAAAVSGPVSPGEISLQAAGQPVEVARAEATVSPVVSPVVELVVAPVREIPQNPASLDFSGGLGTSESWLGANKYILGAILVIAAVVAGIVLLR